jgi:hypothetical protein
MRGLRRVRASGQDVEWYALGEESVLARWTEWLLRFSFALFVVAPWSEVSVRAETAPERRVGWAVEAYPEMTAAEMESVVRSMVRAGANVVWVGHNNPGEVDPGKIEPGLSYAVYEAYQDPSDPRHETSVAMIQAQRRMLDACRAVGVQAVLPVGYQIQMGREWNSRHPDDLRLDAGGQPLDIYGGGVSASFYAPRYREDIATFYRWVDDEFVGPYADVLLMLNLADEPIGGDYSRHAEAEFRHQYGFGFADVGGDPLRQRLLGEFQSRYVVNFAVWTAELWHGIRPGLPVTMSFDGAQARMTYSLPDVEALFRDTPENFVVTFDAYPRDGLPHVPLGDQDLVELFLLARSLGLYSARHARPLWLWAAANSWGLSQASPDPGTVSDAVANGLYLVLLIRQGGGDLQGITYWNYNVKEQGLYNDTHVTAYTPDTMFQRVSEGFPTLRRLLVSRPSRPEVLILVPPGVRYERIGAARESVRLDGQPYGRLDVLAKQRVSAAIVGELSGWSLDGVRAIGVLSPSVGYLSPEDVAILGDYLAAGGRVVTSPDVGKALAAGARSRRNPIAAGLVEQRGNLFIAQTETAVLFEQKNHQVLSGFWQDVLALDGLQPGYQIVTGEYAFLYHLGPGDTMVRTRFPYRAVGHRFDEHGLPVERVHGPYAQVALGRREYALLQRVWWPRPWRVQLAPQ